MQLGVIEKLVAKEFVPIHLDSHLSTDKSEAFA